MAYRILIVFPIPSKSHSILGEGYVRHLLDADHEVTYITPIIVKSSHPRLRQIDVSSNYDIMPFDKMFDISKIIQSKSEFKNIRSSLYACADLANYTIMHPNVQRLIHGTNVHFDVVISEWLFNELYSGFSSVFNCPLIWASSMEPHPMVLDVMNDLLNPAYNPSYLSDLVAPYDFWSRVEELCTFVNVKIYKWWLGNKEKRMFTNAFGSAVEKRGRTLPSYSEVQYNASLMFGNSHVTTGPAICLPQNYVPIGGYHIKESRDPLPVNIQKILQDAKDGLIFFSMGSMAKSSSIPVEIKNDLLRMFGKLNRTILWKFEEDLPDLPRNVHIVPWAPQVEVLGHVNCELFITHGGLLSILESIHFGVPIIGIPLFGDQDLNVNRAVDKGFGKKVDLNSQIAVKMEAAIKEILHDDRFHKKAKEYSFIYHDRLMPQGRVLAHWVSHVIRTNGARHLRSPAQLVPWYQKLYLDLVFAIIFVSYVLFKICVCIKSLCVFEMYTIKLKIS
ncbi:unnamed protein product, partial [Iphiclides podalirius]